jgi:hypothetical protein
MRRALAAVVATAVAAATVAGCAPGPTFGPAGHSAQLSAVPTPQAADPRLTRQICAAAVKATGTTLEVFNEQLASLERAAARGDQASLVEAAEVIVDQVREMSRVLRSFAQKAVTPRVRAALRRAAATLTEITSESYSGSPSDIRRTLSGLGPALAKACG